MILFVFGVVLGSCLIAIFFRGDIMVLVMSIFLLRIFDFFRNCISFDILVVGESVWICCSVRFVVPYISFLIAEN